ncbi:hypothetical protein L9F63_016866 [Diploptera punctata]|uniref:Uncharacterized protein n=1 Tax=Diploptera punctata TaxID=6984 RepID=A0AAD8A213_DIPPU|nr:hypothetical protein L9F63_016866 [Diploptera punctata]
MNFDIPDERDLISKFIESTPDGNDISKFTWSYEAIAEDFTITPDTGYCSPGTTAVIKVEFHPIAVAHNFVYEAVCEFETFRPLILTLSGSCVDLPPRKKSFSSPHQSDKLIREIYQFRINNKKLYIYSYNYSSSETWTLYPEIKGDNFSSPEVITIPPKGIIQCEISYSPLSMTKESKHTGSVFFKLPNGQGLLYDLVGTAEPPLANGKITVDMKTKISHIELLKVKNRFQIAQQYKVITELVRPENTEIFYTLHGNDFISVPGNDEREYKFIIQVYKESNLTFKVMFINENDVTHDIPLENPLPSDVNFRITCFSSEIKFTSPYSVPANSVKYLRVEYFPLHADEVTCRLDINCPELGSFSYELNLTAMPPDEKVIHFTTNLGSECTVGVPVQNFTRNKAEFTCNVDNPDFQVDKTVYIPGNAKGKIDVTYEPSSLVGVQGTFTAKSATAGDFSFLLVGTCIVPRPLGPFIMKQGSTLIINFKNPFRETKVFSLYVDKKHFVLKSKTETIKSRKECKIEVYLPELQQLNFPITGKLLITCNDPQYSHFSWIYYLKGVED